MPQETLYERQNLIPDLKIPDVSAFNAAGNRRADLGIQVLIVHALRIYLHVSST